MTLQGVSKHYRERPAVTEFTLRVQTEERLVLLGPSGCGKTTVLRLLAGLVAPDRGQIDINGEVVAKDGRNLREPQERNLGMVFQDLALWPHLTVRGNIEFGLKAQAVPTAERQKRIGKMLQLMQLQSYAEAWPAGLSGGQQQRVALARALVLQPRLLLMDEPLSSLDLELKLTAPARTAAPARRAWVHAHLSDAQFGGGLCYRDESRGHESGSHRSHRGSCADPSPLRRPVPTDRRNGAPSKRFPIHPS